ncbi:hypothetical protein ACVWXB_000130 [Streptomyces sp. TE12347]
MRATVDGMDAVLRLPLLDTGRAREERGRTPAATATEAIALNASTGEGRTRHPAPDTRGHERRGEPDAP